MEGFQNTNLAILKRYLPLLAAVPYTRGLVLVGSLAARRAGEQSDIDLVVRVQKNRLWINRLLFLLVAAMIGRRRNRKSRSGRFCLNASLAAEKSRAEIISRIHPVSIELGEGSGYAKTIRNSLEFALEFSGVGPMLERAACWLLGAYIRARFERIKAHPEAILILEPNLIAYYPPRATF